MHRVTMTFNLSLQDFGSYSKQALILWRSLSVTLQLKLKYSRTKEEKNYLFLKVVRGALSVTTDKYLIFI